MLQNPAQRAGGAMMGAAVGSAISGMFPPTQVGLTLPFEFVKGTIDPTAIGEEMMTNRAKFLYTPRKHFASQILPATDALLRNASLAEALVNADGVPRRLVKSVASGDVGPAKKLNRQTNECVFRCLPFAIAGNDFQSAVELTHGHPVALATSTQYVRLLQHLIRHGAFGRSCSESSDAYDRALFKDPLIDEIGHVPSASSFEDKDSVLQTAMRSPRNMLTCDALAKNTLRVAQFACHQANSFHDAIMWSIALGGDVEAQCTLSGSLAGALWPVPPQWALACKGSIDARELGEELYARYESKLDVQLESKAEPGASLQSQRVSSSVGNATI
eukprot:GEMP01038457.1.p1 GENE.GEMP01038457.1~~GEMP01038457.1.p1  ORF type:complete len:331 (+),score=68.86 GEMP01038457.1:26-1018(+)